VHIGATRLKAILLIQTPEPDWMAKQFITSPRLPLRFYMDAGTDELDLTGDGGDILVPNRSLRDVLLAKGAAMKD
jgi:hypothetical protein